MQSKILVFLLGLTLSTSASNKQENFQQIHQDLLSLYTPIEQPDEKLSKTGIPSHSGLARFSGDCDDYAMAAASRLYFGGYDPVVYIGKNRSTGTYHMFTCAKDEDQYWCLDNLRTTIVKLDGKRSMETRYEDLKSYAIKGPVK